MGALANLSVVPSMVNRSLSFVTIEKERPPSSAVSVSVASSVATVWEFSSTDWVAWVVHVGAWSLRSVTLTVMSVAPLASGAAPSLIRTENW